MSFWQRVSVGFFLILGLTLGLNMTVPSSQADDFRSCPDDYYSFIWDVRSSNTQRSYFKDFLPFGTSYCQVNDILGLYEQLDALRDNFRDAAFACEDTTEYKIAYNKILMEVYFIRESQNWPASTLDMDDVEALEAYRELHLDVLFDDMYETFVIEEQRVSGSTLELYFEEWGGQYTDRLGQYALCEEGPWAELQESVEDFAETLSGLWELDLEPPERQSLGEVLSPDTEGSDTDVDTGDLGKGIVNAWEFLKTLELRRQGEREQNDETPQSAYNYAQNNPFSSIGEALDAIYTSDIDYDVLQASDERLAAYHLKYGEQASDGSETMQAILQATNALLEETNNKDFPNIRLNAAAVYDRQCN